MSITQNQLSVLLQIYCYSNPMLNSLWYIKERYINIKVLPPALALVPADKILIFIPILVFSVSGFFYQKYWIRWTLIWSEQLPKKGRKANRNPMNFSISKKWNCGPNIVGKNGLEKLKKAPSLFCNLLIVSDTREFRSRLLSREKIPGFFWV